MTCPGSGSGVRSSPHTASRKKERKRNKRSVVSFLLLHPQKNNQDSIFGPLTLSNFSFALCASTAGAAMLKCGASEVYHFLDYALLFVRSLLHFLSILSAARHFFLSVSSLFWKSKVLAVLFQSSPVLGKCLFVFRFSKR